MHELLATLITGLIVNLRNCHELIDRTEFLNFVASNLHCVTIQSFTLIALAWQASRQKFSSITTYKPSSPTPARPDTQFAIALLSCCQSKQGYVPGKSQT